MPLSDPDTVLRLVERIAAVGVVVSSLEWLARPEQLRDESAFGWEGLSTRTAWTSTGPVGAVLGALFRYPAVLAVCAVRLAAAVVLLAPVGPTARVGSVAAITALALLLRLRTPVGLDGSDQMSTIVFVTVALAHLAPSARGVELCLWFLALQACLAYVTAGWLKLTQPLWRDGTYLTRILRSQTYGYPALGTYLDVRPAAARWMTSGVLAFECLFPLALVLPPPAAVVAVATGLAFHVATALTMGLNTFVWSFAAAYPAVLHCSHLWGR
jgi:hypothetical protein